MMTIGILGNNPGRLPRSMSPFRGEMADVKMGVVSPDFSEEYKLVEGYKVFESAAWGYRAMFLVLHNYNVLYGLNTVEALIKRWSHGLFIDWRMYAQAVAKRIGRSCGAAVDTTNEELMKEFVGAMTKVENGVNADSCELDRGWTLFSQKESD